MEQRIIKFKAKRLDNNEWVEGDLQHNRDQVFITSGGYVLAEVDPSTVCQYTGLKDKNGKEIWEGDLLTLFPHDKPREVKFYNGAFWHWCDYLDTYSVKEGICELINIGSKFDKEA